MGGSLGELAAFMEKQQRLQLEREDKVEARAVHTQLVPSHALRGSCVCVDAVSSLVTGSGAPPSARRCALNPAVREGKSRCLCVPGRHGQ